MMRDAMANMINPPIEPPKIIKSVKSSSFVGAGSPICQSVIYPFFIPVIRCLPSGEISKTKISV